MQGIPVTNQEKLKIIKLFEAGESMPSIVKETEVCDTTIRNTLEEHMNGRIDKKGYKIGSIVKVKKGEIIELINPIEYMA